MTTIDNRLVNLGFENQQFEQGVKTSVKSLDNLKQGLKLDESAKSLANLGGIAKSFSLAGISSGVQNISSNFSALGVVGFTVMQSLTMSAIGLAEKFTKAALGVDEMRSGFASYEVKMNATKTVMAGTGETVDQVTKSLNELNNYSDRTIYSFQDMTENISKFTNAGLSSKQAAIAIQGISNVAAISGANTNEAARAMYNFGQAIQQGSVRLMDWKSIENANMATIGFKTQLIETAVAMGTLTKETDGTYKSLKGEVLSATKNFNGSLEQMWLTTDVLNKTLSDYASLETDIGKRANAAATEVGTFTQMMETAKDSIKTGWTKSWQLIFGDLNQSKALFTEISNIIGGFLSSSAKSRNDMLFVWSEFGGRTAIIDGFRNVFNGLLAIMEPVKKAFREIFPETSIGKKLADISKAFRDLTGSFKMSQTTISTVFQLFRNIFGLFDIGIAAVQAIGNALFSLGGLIPKSLFTDVLTFIQVNTEWMSSMQAVIRKGEGFKGVFKNLENIFPGFAKEITTVKDTIKSLEPTFDAIKLAVSDVVDVFRYKLAGKETAGLFSPIGQAVLHTWNVLADFASNVKSVLGSAFEFLKKAVSAVAGVFKYKLKGEITGGMFTPLGISILNVWNTLERFSLSVSNIVTKLKDWWKKLFPEKIETGPVEAALDTFTGNKTEKLGPVQKIFETLGKVFGWFGEVLEKLAPILGKVGGLIATGIGEVGKSIMSGIDNLDYDKIFGALNTGLLAAFVLLVKKFTGGDGMGAATGILKSVSGVLNSVKDSLKAWQADLKSKTLMTIALAVAILAGSLIALSLVDPGKLAFALATISTMFMELVKAMEQISKVSGGNGLTQAAGSLVLIAAAVGLLSISVIALSEIDPLKLVQGLIAVGIILAELVLFMKVSKMDGMGASKGVGLMILATALLVMSTAVGAFAKMDPEKLKQGLLAVGAVLAELAIFTKVSGNGLTLTATATAMVILGGAMLIFANVIEKLGSLSPEQLAKGLGAMGVSLLIVVGAMRLMPKNILITGAGLLIVAGALFVLSKALIPLSKMSWEELAIGLIALGGTMLILAVGVKAMDGTAKGAAALLIVATALAILTPSLVTLGKMSLGELVTSLVVLAGVFVILGVAGTVLGPLAPTLIELSGAMALFGLGIFAIGVGVLAFATGMGMLAVSGAGGAAAIVLLAASILGLVPMIVAALVNGVLTFVTLILEAAPAIIDAVVQIGISLIDAIVALIPAIVGGIIKLLAALVLAVISNLPMFIEAGWNIVLSILKGIRDNIGQLVTVGADIAIKFMDGLALKVPELVKSAQALVLSFINGLGESAKTFTPELLIAVGKLITATLEGLGTAIKAGVEFLGPKVKDLIIGALGFFGIKLDGDTLTAIGTMITNTLNAIGAAITGGIKTVGKFLKDLIKGAITLIFGTELDGDLINATKELARGLLEGIGKGIMDGIAFLSRVIKDLANAALRALGLTWQIASPSKAFYDIAKYVPLGIAKGINDYSKYSTKAIEDLGSDAVSSMTGSVAKITDAISSSMDANPTIRPVLDLSDVRTKVNQMNGLLASKTIDVSGTIGRVTPISYGMSTTNQNDSSQIVQQSSGQLQPVSFIQYNNSPKALSAIEIYRQTRNQLKMIKGLV